ncbi:MAG: flagellar export chaperone FlgN [candidate division Zixibacteria bacterium]|nr:flagellar export chaperone FlgN [candidate division Zixibacteria bacterium]
MVNRLIEIIGREATLLESFLELLEQQQAVLVANDREALDGTTADIREKLVESSLLNKQREKLVEQIKATNAIEGDLNVTRLLEIVDQNQADQLLKLRNLIYSLDDKITDVRNQNAALLNQSREYISKMMEMLSNFSNPEVAYAPDGVIGRANQNLAVDRRV